MHPHESMIVIVRSLVVRLAVELSVLVLIVVRANRDEVQFPAMLMGAGIVVMFMLVTMRVSVHVAVRM